MATSRRPIRRTRRATSKAPVTTWQQFENAIKPANIKAYWLSSKGFRMGGKIAGGAFLLLFLVFLFYAKDLPSPSKINAKVGAQTTRFYDRTGKTILYEVFGDKNRSVIGFDQMPKTIKEATVSVEDRSFYKHGAFSTLGILRAAFVDLFHRGRGLQGGSTITQQYVKNALLNPNDRSFSRKIKELILSLEIEQFYKKDDILKLYLNEIPYGSQAYGIQAGAQTYFRKDAKDLTIDEAALLAGIPRAPTYYSPYGLHRDALLSRQHLILDLMAEQGYITKQAAADAKKVDIFAKMPARPAYFANVKAPHFVLYVQELLEQKYGPSVVNEGGLKVITSLDLEKQKAAEEAIAKNMKQIRSLGGSNAAIVSGDPKTGQILSMVGSYDFSDPDFGAYNVAIADRQPGSSFKPFVYSTAWQKNWGPGSTLYDTVTDFGGGYKPTNFGNRSYGVLSMRGALGGSLNVPAVKTLYIAGVDNSIKTAHDMGITTLKNDSQSYGLSLVLGAGEVKLNDMVNAYEGFAAGGIHQDQTAVMKITDPKGKVLEEYKQSSGKRVLDPQIAYLMNHVLADLGAKAFVFGNYPPFIFSGRPVAIKTGTTENFRDAWTMGYTPSLVTGVWVGNNDGRSMGGAAGAIAAPVFHDYMATVLAGTPVEQFTRPSGIQEVTLDGDTGRLPTDTTKTRRTDIFPSWYKPIPATQTRSAVVDKVSGKLATDCTPELAKETRYASEIHAEIPPTDIAFSRWEPPVQELAKTLGYNNGGTIPTESDDVHHCNDTKPVANLTVSEISNGVVRITANWTSGTFPVNKLDIAMDGQIISTQQISSGSDKPYEFQYNAGNGTHNFKETVTDTGLYQDEDAKTLDISGAVTVDFHGIAPTANPHSLTPTYIWTPYPGTGIKYKLFLDGAVAASNISGTSKTIPTTLGFHTWYVEAFKNSSTLAKADPITFTNSIP